MDLRDGRVAGMQWFLYGMLGMEGGHVIGGCNDGIIICSRFTGSPPGSAAAMVILELVVNRLLFKLIVQYREDLNFCDDQQNEKFTLLWSFQV